VIEEVSKIGEVVKGAVPIMTAGISIARLRTISTWKDSFASSVPTFTGNRRPPGLPLLPCVITVVPVYFNGKVIVQLLEDGVTGPPLTVKWSWKEELEPDPETVKEAEPQPDEVVGFPNALPDVTEKYGSLSLMMSPGPIGT